MAHSVICKNGFLLAFIFALATLWSGSAAADNMAGAPEEIARGRAAPLQQREVIKQSAEARTREPLLPPWGFLTVGALAFLICMGLVATHQRSGRGSPSPTLTALSRWTMAVALISWLYALFYGAYPLPDWFFSQYSAQDFAGSLIGSALWRVAYNLVGLLYFPGNDYAYFSDHIAGPLYLYLLLGHLAVLRYVIRADPSQDKGWHLARSVHGRIMALAPWSGGAPWSRRATLALMALAVKAFFAPIMINLAIKYTYKTARTIRAFRWDFKVAHFSYAALLSTIDVAIFAFGYFVELPQLDNEIISVEPTFLGWTLCLMCYPPFNRFSFQPMRLLWPRLRFTAGKVLRHIAMVLAAGLWSIYVAATITLGARASNLTHRGIVDTGPYGFVRHPAYASKTIVWLLTSLFLGGRSLPMVAALITIYVLRAWTEERHLSADPAYLEYCEKVPDRFIPGVI